MPFSEIRVLPFQKYNGVENMCLDIYYAQQMEYNPNPILRFYGWEPFCLSLGHHQKTELINLEKLHENGFDVVRRPTGGSAIFHSDELTYSLILPISLISHHDIYSYFHENLAKALNNLGYSVTLTNTVRTGSYLNQATDTFACFNRSALSEIQFNEKKVVGSAQKLLKNAVLQHGSLMLKATHEKITDYLIIDEEERLQQKKLLQAKSISLQQISNRKINKNELADALLATFENAGVHIYYQYPSKDEIEKALILKDSVLL